MKSASELLQQFRNGIPKTAVNWSSDNSDISFIWTPNFLAVLDLWHALDDHTEKEDCIEKLTAAVDWVFTMTDEALGWSEQAAVTVEWNPLKYQVMSLGAEGYAKSPSEQINPGWTRYIDVGDGVMGFRPEILASGVIGYAIASFIDDCWDELDQEQRTGWLEKLADIFEYHDPNWRNEKIHSPGVLYDMPHTDLMVSGYWWPTGVGPGIDPTMPGLNQQAQFLSMGVITEKLLGRDIQAKARMSEFCNTTLPKYMQLAGNERAFTLYDFRDNPNERANDTVHHQHSMPIFIHGNDNATRYQQMIINQVRYIHRLGGKFPILADGSDFHDGRDRETDINSHPDAAVWADCLLFDNGSDLLDIARQTLENHVPNTWSHKEVHFHARYLRAVKALKTGKRSSPESVFLDDDTDMSEDIDNEKKSMANCPHCGEVIELTCP